MDKAILTFEQPALLFSALGHPVRLAMLEILREGEACVCHLQAGLRIRQAYASQHLNILRQAGLVNSRKEGTRVYYELTSPDLEGIIDRAKKLLIEVGKLSPEELDPVFDMSHSECGCPQCQEIHRSERITQL